MAQINNSSLKCSIDTWIINIKEYNEIPISMDEILIAFQCMQKILMYNHSIDSYILTSIQFYNLPSLLKQQIRKSCQMCQLVPN